MSCDKFETNQSALFHWSVLYSELFYDIAS